MKNLNSVDSVASSLSYHYSRGNNKYKAAKYLSMLTFQLHQNSVNAETVKTYKQAISIIEKIDYPDKERFLIEMRDRIVSYCLYSDATYAIENSEKLTMSLFKMAGGKDKVLKVIKVMRLIYKLINLLPERIAIKIKNKVGEEHPMPPIPKTKFAKLRAKLFPDYQFIIPKIVSSDYYFSDARISRPK